ncbi:YusW family protein [Alkalicoccus halolimnae]|uniref:YusW family protein n=1 Tax=Alkalicoccus halolimnae TaxID=1667239 RepID=A0AAJ8N1A6_9BACI|nr:YusW family protein [Alkalicoccus halolimnae]
MKKVIAGISVAALLAACSTQEVEPEETSTADEADVQAEENSPGDAEEMEETEAGNSNSTEETADSTEENTGGNNSGETETQSGSVENVHEFDLQVEFHNDEEWEFEYELDDDSDMEVERDGQEKVTGAEAREEIEVLLEQINITTDRPLAEMRDEVLAALDIAAEDVEDVNLEIEYTDGETIEFDHESGNGEEKGAAEELDMDIDFFSGEEWQYEYERSDREGEIEKENGEEIEIEGQEAVEEIEALLGNIDITMDRSIDEMKQEVLAALDVEQDDVRDFDMDVEYENGETVKFKHDVE